MILLCLYIAGMARVINEAGNRYGRLRVISEHIYNPPRQSAFWLCVCDCGKETIVGGPSLRKGNTKSCGCLQRDVAVAVKTKHGCAAVGRMTPEYRAWSSMKSRCGNYPNSVSYKDYAGRGIKVCQRWLDSFDNFLADMGPKPDPSYELDRIDVNGNYEPSNARWATKKLNRRNRRTAYLVEYNGEKKPLGQWCEDLGIDYDRTYGRLRRGIPPELAFK